MSSPDDLVALAREDGRLLQFERQLATLPKRIEELDLEKQNVEQQIANAEAVFEKTEREARKIDVELQEYRQRRKRSEGRQSSLTSTDQYQALLKEIEKQDARIDELESAVLEALDRSEQAGTRRDAETARLTEERQRLQALQDQLRADLETAKTGVEEQRKRRDVALEKIDAQTRALYERVLRSKGDAAIALVSDKVCGICNGVQPPQVLQSLRQSTGLQICQICGRILVWNPETA